jgi:hypothetical protein
MSKSKDLINLVETKKPKFLYKTTIVVWSEYDPSKLEASELVHDGEIGDSYISSQDTIKVNDKEQFPDVEFFGVED